MRSLRYLSVIALVISFAQVAKADDFAMVVVDPTVPIALLQPVFANNFSVTFPTSGPQAGCQPSQLTGIPAAQQSQFDACFTGINLTGADLTSLQIELPTFTLPGQSSIDTPSCPTFTSDEFANISCVINSSNTDYVLDFSGGDIPTATFRNTSCFFDPSNNFECDSPSIFTIAIGFPGSGLTPQQIDQVINTNVNSNTVADANVVVSPEPNPVLLTSTGVFSLVLFGLYRRRQGLAMRTCPARYRD